MAKNRLPQSVLLERVTSEALEEVLESETVLESLARICDQANEALKLRLRGQRILLYSKEQEEEGPLACITLNLSLRFQKILASQQLPQAPGSFGPQTLKGFKLSHQNGSELSFFIQFPELTEMWLKFLGRLICQGGFHKQFKPVRKLGRGASASVYEIASLEDGRRLAAKVFSKEELRTNSQKFYSFRNQVETLRSLQHENVIGLQGVFETDHSYYLVSQVLRGGNLLEYLLRSKTLISLQNTRTLIRGLLVGLAELERADVVHRDIKLENLMLRDNNSLDPVIVDFGLAVNAWEEDYGYYKCGTPGYLSPQIVNIAPGHKLTPKSDVFSAGVVLHVLLVSRYLFDGKDPKTVFEKNKRFQFDLSAPEYSKIDVVALDLLRKMLAINPEERLSASECLEHPFVRVLEEKVEVSPASTSEDYHF